MKCPSCGTEDAKEFAKNGKICKVCAEVKADIRRHYLKIEETDIRHNKYRHEKVIEGFERMLEIRKENILKYQRRQK